MPRRKAPAETEVVDNDSSSKENTPAVKAEKVAALRVKQEAAKNSRRQVEDDEHEDPEEQEGSSKGAKRSRVNLSGDSRESVEPETIKTHPRDVDGFIPGSIVRIQLSNFLTYDFVEFRPGSHLNMIIGPNGTGKSSIACAICLGLNFPPSLLGRAQEINSYVKNTASSGYIEIELKGLPGKPNVVIRRNINGQNKTSSFTLNGQSASGKDITEKTKELNVQVSNLCSFLPQDKVSEFAAMSSQQLLKETQRAAGDQNLTKWHEMLISAGRELKGMEDTINSETEQLKQMRERNEGIERDVQRFRERQQIEHEIALLNLLLPVQTYRETRRTFIEAKAAQRVLHDKVTKMMARNKGAHDFLNKLEGDLKKLDKERDSFKKKVQGHLGQMQKKWTSCEDLETQTEDLNNDLEKLNQNEKERANKIKKAEATIQHLQEEMKKQVEVDRPEVLEDMRKQLNLERRDVQTRAAHAQGEIRAIAERAARVKQNQENLNRQLDGLNNVDTQKLRSLQQFDRDTHDVLLWLRNNQDKFKQPIIEPPIMTVTVQAANGRLDQNLVNAIEGCFGLNQLKSFIAQNHEDYNTFNRLVQDGNVIGRKVRVSTWFRGYDARLAAPPPFERDELEALHFDGYAMDFITFPEGMAWFLQCDLNLHRTAIAVNGQAVDVSKAMDSVGRAGGANFVTGTVMHQVGRSKYGQKHVQNVTRELKRARVLGGAKVDEAAKARIDSQIKEAAQELDLIREEEDKLQKKHRAIEEEDKVFEKRHQEIDKRKKAIQDERKRQVSLQGNLVRHQNTLAQLKNGPSLDRQRADLKKRITQITKKRVALFKEYGGLGRSIIADQNRATQLGLQWVQVCANKGALQELCDKKERKFLTVKVAYEQADKVYKNAKVRSQEALALSRQVIAEAEGELKTEYRVIENTRTVYDEAVKNGQSPSPEGVDLRTAEELTAELEAQKTKLEMTLAGNPHIVEQYEKRKRDIETLEKTIQDRQKRAERVERNIKQARESWKPALEKLVASIGSRFSAAFDRIGCAGEIRINENEDYDKWAIDILVKFREDEKLQLLTGQRQSGGERSLTTILYLMALTEEARAPFSLVDEINQGMDQRAERVVHNSMVEVTCKEDSAQYFLITPKLLADLNYHERMKILCVNNGEWLPEERGLGNMMGMIEGYVAHRQR